MNESVKARNDLQKARMARQAGNEGKARVLCRLAAASAIKDFFTENRPPAPLNNAYGTILNFSKKSSLPAGIQTALSHLLMRVDEDYNLSEGIDLVSDVELLIQFFESGEDF